MYLFAPDEEFNKQRFDALFFAVSKRYRLEN